MYESHEYYLRRAIEVSKQSRAAGNTPFGALLVDAEGNILMEQQNIEITEHICTGHAETTLAARASQAYSREFLSHCTLYTTAEPCAMCAGAIYWAGGLRHDGAPPAAAHGQQRAEPDLRSALPRGLCARPAQHRGHRPHPRGGGRGRRRPRGLLELSAQA